MSRSPQSFSSNRSKPDGEARSPLGRGAYEPTLCPRCELFRAPTEAELRHCGRDLRGTCQDRISGTKALTCNIGDLSFQGAAKEQARCRIARGEQRPRPKKGPLPPKAPVKRKFVDLEHGAYHPRLCPKCSYFRLPSEEELDKYGSCLKGACEAGTRRMPRRYLIYDQREMSRRDVYKDCHRCWQIRHKEEVRAMGRDWYRMHRSEWLARDKNWRKKSAWKGRSISPKLRFEVLQRDGFRCVYCGRSAADVPLEIDHVVPVAGGGKTEEDNLVTACGECNAGKKTLSTHGSHKNFGNG